MKNLVILSGALLIGFGAVSCANSFEESVLGLVLAGAFVALVATSSRGSSTFAEPRQTPADIFASVSDAELERWCDEYREEAQRGPSSIRASWVHWQNELDRRRKMKK